MDETTTPKHQFKGYRSQVGRVQRNNEINYGSNKCLRFVGSFPIKEKGRNYGLTKSNRR